jgi:hypothetical protein
MFRRRIIQLSKNQGFMLQIAKVMQLRRQNDRFFPVCTLVDSVLLKSVLLNGL